MEQRRRVNVCSSDTYRGQLRLIRDRIGGDDRLLGGRGVGVAEVRKGVDSPPGLQVLRHPD